MTDMTKFYDGFILLNYKTKEKYKFRYVKGTRNFKVEEAAIDKVAKAIDIPSANLAVSGFVKKGEWSKDSTPEFKG